MKVIRLSLGKRSYLILIGYGISSHLADYLAKAKIGNAAYLVTNKRLFKSYGRRILRILRAGGFAAKCALVADTEKSKSLKTASALIDDIAQFEKNRRVFLVALGGGVVGDLAGFVASIYKRGIPLIQIPTTLLAQVDSAIGGKTAVDLLYGKNLVGTFYQPRLVMSDTQLLTTLDTRQLRNGLAEVIKYAIIKDPLLFTYLESHYKDILGLQQSALAFIVSRCARIKAGIVMRDEKEELGLRTLLNFGHTIGHAIEAAGGYKRYTHGEAIALGMRAACDISRYVGLLDHKTQERISRLLHAVGLPAKTKGLSLGKILNAHYRDKKFIGTRNRFVLASAIGKAKVVENIPLAVIKKAIQNIR